MRGVNAGGDTSLCRRQSSGVRKRVSDKNDGEAVALPLELALPHRREWLYLNHKMALMSDSKQAKKSGFLQ